MSEPVVSSTESAITSPAEEATSTATAEPARRPTDMARLARAEKAPRCCHIKINGLRCGSPALRANVLCYFHDKWLNSAADDILPPLEDGNGVQFSLMYMVSRLRKECFRDGEANIAAVKQLLYALQTASHNLRYVNFDPKLKTPGHGSVRSRRTSYRG